MLIPSIQDILCSLPVGFLDPVGTFRKLNMKARILKHTFPDTYIEVAFRLRRNGYHNYWWGDIADECLSIAEEEDVLYLI